MIPETELIIVINTFGNQEITAFMNNAQGNVATLELTSQQSELLALANSMGEISLALRSIADVNADKNVSKVKKKKTEERTSISVLRYGVKQRAYGVN